jgi:hypothetical protein
MAEYEIKFSSVRQKRGMPCYAICKKVDPTLANAVSAHHTREEALKALAELKAKDAE